MPYDPSLPLTGSPLDSSVVRGQFTGLKSLIDAVPGITAAAVDSVNTVAPGQPASAGAQIVETTLHLTFSIPQGYDGLQGPPGPSVAGAVVDGVSTLNPGSSATVTTSFDGSNVHFSFGIPQGATGADGEVTAQELEDAIATTSANTNAVGTLDTPFADPDMEMLRTKLNEMLLAARRA